MESHTAKFDEDYLNQTPTKLSKKEKKKLKEAKKLKNTKHDADKVRMSIYFSFLGNYNQNFSYFSFLDFYEITQDLDTSEIKSETTEKKKKKKKFLF